MPGLKVAVLVIGILGALCTGIFSIPGLVIIVKNKNTVSVSLAMYIILACGSALFVLMSLLAMPDYGIGLIGITIGNGASLGMTLPIIIIKVKNMKDAKNNGMTERQWCDKLYKESKENKASTDSKAVG